MKTKTLVCLLAAAVLAGGLIVTKTFAADNAVGAAAHGHFWQRIANKLQLTADQKTHIKSVLTGDKDTLAPLLSASHDAHKNLRAAIQAGDANEASVRAAAAKVAAVEADLAVERMKLYGKIAPLLTGAQRTEVTAMQERTDAFVDDAISRLASGLGN
jgi:Spy/CpxP family protein refolding chaperone